VRYIVEEKGNSHPIFTRTVYLADQLIKRDERLIRFLQKENIAPGLPRGLGGISHPVGMKNGYISTLTQEFQDICFGMLHEDPLEVLRSEFLSEDPERGVDPQMMEAMLDSFFKFVSTLEITDRSTVEASAELAPGRRFPDFRSIRKSADNLGVMPLSECLGSLKRKLTFYLSLTGKVQVRPSRPLGSIRRANDRLKLSYCGKDNSLPLTNDEAQISLVGLNKALASKRASLYIPRVEFDNYMSLFDFPSMQIKFAEWRIPAPPSVAHATREGPA